MLNVHLQAFINMFPVEISAVSVTLFDSYRALKWQKVYKLGLCGHFRDFKVTLKFKVTYLNFFHRLRIHVEGISTTVTDLSDLPLLSNREKYGKNVEKMSKYGL